MEVNEGVNHPKKHSTMVVLFSGPDKLLWQMRQYSCSSHFGRGWLRAVLKDFIQSCKLAKKKIISEIIDFISAFYPLPTQSPPKRWNCTSPTLLTRCASNSFPPSPCPSVFGRLLCLKYSLVAVLGNNVLCFCCFLLLGLLAQK
jgi:hypothetical protein